MSVVPHHREIAEVTPVEGAKPEARAHSFANAISRTKDATANALVASREAWSRAAELKREAARSRVAQRVAELADKTVIQTRQAATTAVTASKTGLTKATQLGRETVLPEIGRTGLKIRERIRVERLKQDWRNFLIRLHESVLDAGIEKLMFVPTRGNVAIEGLTVIGDHKAQGHDYRPSPRLVFEWALAAIDEDFSRLGFVDYGAGKGRALLLASQYPFLAIGGIESAEELHDATVMNIAQFPRSRMKCRNVECVFDDAAEIGPLDGPAIHYFFDPFSREVFAQVLDGIVASYREQPRRLYLILIDPVAEDLVEKSGSFAKVRLPAAQRLRARLFSPYEIAVYRSLA